jgi:hypothetical protein
MLPPAPYRAVCPPIIRCFLNLHRFRQSTDLHPAALVYRLPSTTTNSHTQFTTLNMSDNGSPNGQAQQKPEDGGQSEHLNIKVTDNNNEVFFKIKRTTALGKLMNAFCDRQGKNIQSVRFLFDGQRVTAQDNPDTVRMIHGFQC